MVATFTNGLRMGKFLFSLDKNNSKTMLEILYRATKYMNTEDVLLAKEEKPRKRERLEDTRRGVNVRPNREHDTNPTRIFSG